ncbi:MAG: hypothetical protein HYZ34_05180, partial [Ignavibacteriae bacterium]|nr:hypothetical protein [Ignavibacteriota bacterium]
MKEFTNTLKQIMSVVSNQLELLPASKGAVEEMTFVGEEERDDTKLSGDNLLVETSLEIPKPAWKYRSLQPINRKTNHFFRYFLDGSYRHYFLATGLEHDRATPIFLAQIAIVILERDDEGKLSIVHGFKRHQWFLLLAKSRISEAAWERIQKSTRESKVNIIIKDLVEMDAYSGDFNEAQDLRERGRSKTRHLMSTMEFELVREFKEKISNHWMIKDGLVSFGKYGGGMQSTGVIGVAKSFTSVQKFHSQTGKSREKQNVVSLLGELPPNHRTTAYEGYGGKTAFWYIRLRKSQQVLYPLFGVIKVEIPFLSEQPLTTELLDEISGALLGERSVTPYGSDERWHSHLYPIYQAEHASKQQFFSLEVIQG